MEFERLIAEQLRAATLSRGSAGRPITAAAPSRTSSLAAAAGTARANGRAMVDADGVSSTFARDRHKARIDGLDRRCLSLSATVEGIQRTLSALEATCNRQSLEAEIRRVAADLVRPAIAAVSSKAESAANTALVARAEVSAIVAAKSIPNVHQILDHTVVSRGTGSNPAALPDGGAYFHSHREYERARDREYSRQELMWERIDNHLACHELRLRQSIADIVQAAVMRHSATGQVLQKDDALVEKKESRSNQNRVGSGMGSNETQQSSLNQQRGRMVRRAWDAEDFVPLRDFRLLQRRLDEVVVTVHELAKSTRVQPEQKLCDGEDAKLSNTNGLGKRLNVNVGESGSGDDHPLGDIASRTTERGAHSQSGSTGSVDVKIADLQRIIEMMRAQVLEMRDDLISVKLESSSRLYRLARLEQQVRTLLVASGAGEKPGDVGVAPTDSLSSSSPRLAPSPKVPLKSIGQGKPMQQWGAADVDQWLLFIGTKEAVRRRFLELEIDGEMLSLLEKSDLVGGIGENGIKTGMDIVTAFGGTSEEGIIEVDRLMREIAMLKRAHGVPLSPGAESVATDGTNEDDNTLLDAPSSGSPSPPYINSQDFSTGNSSPSSSTRVTELESIRRQLASYGYTNN
eukprot:g2966.t1